MSNIIRCDKCRKETEAVNRTGLHFSGSGTVTYEYPLEWCKEEDGKHYCEECRYFVRHWIREYTRNHSKHTEKEFKESSRQYDLIKMVVEETLGGKDQVKLLRKVKTKEIYDKEEKD